MKRYRVSLVSEAERDLAEIVDYVASHDTVSAASHLLEGIEGVCSTLRELPTRGHCPVELARVGVTRYRELHFKPYRIFYDLAGSEVLILAILDGRRDLQSLLEWRLLR